MDGRTKRPLLQIKTLHRSLVAVGRSTSHVFPPVASSGAGFGGSVRFAAVERESTDGWDHAALPGMGPPVSAPPGTRIPIRSHDVLGGRSSKVRAVVRSQTRTLVHVCFPQRSK